MIFYVWFLPALIALVMGVSDPPAISVDINVKIGNPEVPARESTRLSERQALRRLGKVRNRSPIPPEYCTPFQFSNCAQEAEQDSVISIQDNRNAWDCSRSCGRENECKSWMFRHEGDDHGKCWLVKTQAGQTVKELCTRHQGTVLPFNVVDQLDSCLEGEKLYQRRCKVGECIQLKHQYKIGEKQTKTESDCKFACEVKITTEPRNNCSNYQWDQETEQCTLYSIYENVGARAAADDLNCRIVAGTKNMTKKEVDHCSHFRESEYKPRGPQRNVPLDEVQKGRWTICYQGTYSYDDALTDDKIQEIADNDCTGSNIMVACGYNETGSIPSTLKLLAWSPREYVFQHTTGQGVTANGVRWYRSTEAQKMSWGFAPEDAKIKLSMGDGHVYEETDSEKRLSWHTFGTGSVAGGLRCGEEYQTFYPFKGERDWKRLIFQLL